MHTPAVPAHLQLSLSAFLLQHEPRGAGLVKDVDGSPQRLLRPQDYALWARPSPWNVSGHLRQISAKVWNFISEQYGVCRF